jgi:lipopolysaccharide export LptBFGC system permease protein LptF
VVDPVIADWQAEYEEATSGSSVWKPRWVRYSGYGILFRALLVYGCWRLAMPWQGWSPEERGSLGRMVGTAIVATVVLTALLAYQPVSRVAMRLGNPAIVALLIPQAIPIAAPLGLLLGILYASRGGPLSRRVIRGSLLSAVAVSIGSFVLLNQIIPAANQAFRVEVFKQSQPDGDPSVLSRGLAEMTLTDLRRQVVQARRSGVGAEAVRRLDFRLQERRALAAAALPLAVFALVIGTRRRYGLAVLGFAGGGITATYYALMIASDQLTRLGAMPAVAVWLPHLGVLALAASLLSVHPRPAPVPSDDH